MKRLVAIVISLMVMTYFLVFFILPFPMIEVFNNGDIWEQIILLILPIIGSVLITMMVMVLRERLKELDKGEDDDLSKY